MIKIKLIFLALMVQNFILLSDIINIINEYLIILVNIAGTSSLINILIVLLPVLLSVAFMTIIERKQLAAHQRRVGPNTVGRKHNN